MSNARFSPPPVIDGLVGLHRGDDVQVRETLKIGRGHVLGVFDAPSPIFAAVLFFHSLLQIQRGGDGGVANGVRTNL